MGLREGLIHTVARGSTHPDCKHIPEQCGRNLRDTASIQANRAPILVSKAPSISSQAVLTANLLAVGAM